MPGYLKVKNSQLLIIGIIAAVIVGIGEWLLHYNPMGYEDEIEMLLNVPLQRASLGHYMVVFGAPLYFAGYFGLYRIFRRDTNTWASIFLIGGILSFSIGGVWVSSRYLGAETLQLLHGTQHYDQIFESYANHYQSLVWILRILILIVSISYAAIIQKNKQGLPNWLTLCNPLLLLILVFAVYFIFPVFGNHLVATAMNVAHLIFFTILYIYISNLKNPVLNEVA